MSLLHGCEVWNGKADGRWFPSTACMERLSNLRMSHSHLLPLAGVDLHRLESYPDITLRVECAARTCDGVVDGIASGAFTVTAKAFRFSARDPLRAPANRDLLGIAGMVYRLKRWAQGLDRRLAARGRQAPEPLYRLARKLLR